MFNLHSDSLYKKLLELEFELLKSMNYQQSREYSLKVFLHC